MSGKAEESYQKSSDQQTADEVLREIIRQKLEQKFQNYNSQELDEMTREQIREAIKREMFEERHIQQEKKTKFDKIKQYWNRSVDSAANFLDPGPSHYYNGDDDSEFQEQMKMAIELSKLTIQPNNNNNQEDKTKNKQIIDEREMNNISQELSETERKLEYKTQNGFIQVLYNSYQEDNDELMAHQMYLDDVLEQSKQQANLEKERKEMIQTRENEEKMREAKEDAKEMSERGIISKKLEGARQKDIYPELPEFSDDDESEIECGICFGSTTDPISYGCAHHFCSGCVKMNLDTAIEEGLVESMECPDPECKLTASQELVRRLVSEEMYVRYETLLLKMATADMDDIFYCTNANCGAIIEAEVNIGLATCSKCGHIFCTSCSKPFHGTSDCELKDEERQQMVQLYSDELIAEQLLSEESLNQLAFEAIDKENEEWLKMIREEQNAIRLQEQIENEEIERQQEEARRINAEQLKAEEEQKERERIEYERVVQQNKERERQEKLKSQKRREQDALSENTVRQVTKKCPQCSSPIEKNGGCVHMTCTKCRHEFCWECRGYWRHDHTCQ